MDGFTIPTPTLRLDLVVKCHLNDSGSGMITNVDILVLQQHTNVSGGYLYTYELTLIRYKAGYTATPFACGWTGAIFEVT